MKLNKKLFVILVSLLFTFLCGCTQNTQSEPTEQPHLYWKDIDVVVENVDSRHWFASTHHHIVYVTVRSDEYQLIILSIIAPKDYSRKGTPHCSTDCWNTKCQCYCVNMKG